MRRLAHLEKIEVVFYVSLMAKAVLAVFQLLSGFALLVLPIDSATNLVRFLVRNELAEDPSDPIAQMVEKWLLSIDPNAGHFYVVYLLSHGSLHTFVILSLLMKWRIAYPFSLATLIGFVFYQSWHYFQAPDMLLLVLTAIDLFVIVIVILEHRRTVRLAR